MPGQHNGWFGELPWYRKVIAVVLVPLLLPAILFLVVPILLLLLLLFGPLYLFAELDYRFREFRFRQQMKQKGLFKRWCDAREQIAALGGTLIIDSPTMSWSISRAWWTAERLLILSPYEKPSVDESRELNMRCSDWDRWCYDNYVNPDTGRAWLVQVGTSKRSQRKLKESFPALAVASTWSFPAAYPETAEMFANDTRVQQDSSTELAEGPGPPPEN